MGGAINLVTKTGYDAGLIELRSEAGSYDFFKITLPAARAGPSITMSGSPIRG